ncbi:MAG: citrate synthase [Acidimicrobiales bacterium]
MEGMVSTDEAARRLGVKVTTLYAYVSRGMLESHRDPAGKGSLFELSDIESLAARSRGARRPESRLATIATGVTQLSNDEGPLYRGRAATSLLAHMTFEEVTGLLWETSADGDWSVPDLGACPLSDTLERMRWALVLSGATDQLRADLRPLSVTRAARRVIAGLVDVVGPAPTGESGSTPISERLARRLGGSAPASSAAAVNAALILMADHELATSTMAVRIAGSVRADLYDALTAGLVTLAGPLHGGASKQAYELLATAEREGAQPALNDALRERRHLPGFGHPVYRSGDPRFRVLLPLAEHLLSEDRRTLLRDVLRLAAEHDIPLPNCDLALAALSWGTGMPPDTGRTIFAVARIAGWTAHYLEELAERPLRFRARAVYVV